MLRGLLVDAGNGLAHALKAAPAQLATPLGRLRKLRDVVAAQPERRRTTLNRPG
jgi:hypothetical protein